jgi:HEPN domain-containing protein
MNRKQWKVQAEEHCAAAKALLREGNYSAAYYLAGLAVECALKAKISRSVKAGDWPDKDFTLQVHTHKLSALVSHAQLEAARITEGNRSTQFRLNWNTVKDWRVESRYQVWTQAQARDMVEAVGKRGSGVLAWIKGHW